MEDQPFAIQATPHLPVSLNTLDLAHKVAEFQRIVQARAIAQALDEIDRAFTEALVDPLLRQGAPAEEVAVAVERVAAVTEAIKRPLLRRFSDYLEEDARVRDARAERANRRMRSPAPSGEPVVTPIESCGAPLASPVEPRMELIGETRS